MQKCLLPVAASFLLLTACAGTPVVGDAEDRADRVREAVRPAASLNAVAVPEAFATPMTPADNIDSVASWTGADGQVLLLATAKATHRLVIYDGSTGAFVRHVGAQGAGPGQFDRPNGIAVVDDLAFVVERDNHRVQVLRLPGMETVAEFGADVLKLPYGLWVNPVDGGYEVYVTDAYMAGEDAAGEDILPPLAALDRRVHRFAIANAGRGLTSRHVGAFGDTSPAGALRVVESLWGDAANDRLLVAEEDETYANEFKVYNLQGRFTGRTIDGEFLKAQAEGIMLKTCADGGGWWITTEQGKGRTAFHLFERDSLAHAGVVAGPTVANTDGIWLHDAPTPQFPEGVLYAVHDDQGAVAIDWREIATALKLPACAR
ncbi:phytase [Luteimonas terrae]|uniref:3-phytase n=1 Tax=Luteimonas terrae TaxID=1530191 RepID=A0ABU1XZE1_9GAMM|nr:phytase [Luteimonas terrae]MDR7194132.1 3-phytase [Luteimonas terrae]